jgi:shikimate kinase
MDRRCGYAVNQMASHTKLVLIGFMASGKSAVAMTLASKLNLPLVHVDEVIVSRSGYPTIPAIFADRGEAHFRDLEAEVAASLREAHNVVISTGGGIITRESNMTNLKENGGTIVYLRTSFDVVTERAGDLSTRPLFANKATALELYAQRLPIYERYADIIIDTDGRSVDEVCSEILTQIR